MQQSTASKNTDDKSSPISSFQQPLLFQLIQTDVWTNLFEKFNLRESRSIWITQLTTLNDYQLVLRCEDGLRIFQYSQKQCTWQQLLYSEDFCDKNGFDKACYALQFWKIPQLNKEILICRIQDGFFFADYDPSKHELRPLAQDSLFPDSGRWFDEHNQLQWGSFYGPGEPLGLFTRHVEQGVRFYISNPNGFNVNERPIWEDCNTNKHIQSIWRAKDDHFEFADITGTGITNIIRQNDEGLSIYAFQIKNENFVLEELIKTDLCNKDSGWRPGRDKLYFTHLTKGPFSNLVLLQSDGLRVYHYIEEEKRFDCLNHDTSMAERFGWNQEHSNTLLFADITGNGLMQLIYTGPRGLTICSFNPDTRKWENNLNPNELNLENKYAIPSMFIPSNRSPTQTPILITNLNGQLNWVKIEKRIVQSDFKLSSNISSNGEEIKSVKSRLVPQQGELVVRPKSIAFLRDTLDIKPLLSAVNTYTGKLDFTLPFLSVGTGPNGLKIQLALRYQGINPHASILGVGWNLVEDYMAVDYQGNIDPLTHRYYWITSHGSMPLLCQSSQTDPIQSFRLATSYDLFLIQILNINNLPNIQGNAVILVGPSENNDYYAYRVQNNQWLRNKEDNHLNKTLIKNIDVNNLEPVEQNGLIKITDTNLENIVKVIRIATSNENYFDRNIIYYSDKHYWEMKSLEGEKRIYGNVQQQVGTTDAIAWTIGWENWLGIGNDTTNQKRYPVRWHLKEIQGYETEKITYNYDTVQRPVGNESFTQSLYLKTISDNYNNTIHFNYEKKSSEEYQEPILNDENGNLQLSPTFGHYLKNIKIITRVNIQTIEFQYQLQNQIRHLVALSQPEDTCQEPILKFSYQDCQLDQIRLPNGEKLSFIYQMNKLEHIGHSSDVYSGKHLLREQPQITMGSNYLILSEIFKETLNFKILQTNKTPFVVLPSIQGVSVYRVFAREDYFGFIVKNNNISTLFLYYRRVSGEWLLKPKQYSISVFKIEFIDNDLILINPQQQIIIIHWNIEQQIWQETVLLRPANVSQNSELFFTTNQSLVIVYDDQHLWIGYKDFHQNWQIKYLRYIPNYFLKTKQTLDKFEISSTLSENISDGLKLQVLQCHKNIICLSSWQEENNLFKSLISIFMLDENSNIRLEKLDTVLQQEFYQDIFSKSQEQEFIEGEKITYRLTYEKQSNEKFRVVFEPQEITKEIEIEKVQHYRLYQLKNQEITIIIQGIKSCVIYNKQTGKWFTEMTENLQNNTHSLTDYFQEILLIDLTKYLPQLNFNQITFGNQKWLFNGYEWQEKIIDENILPDVYTLGTDYILSKANKEASLKLYKQDTNGQLTGDSIFDFNVSSWENIYNGYPNYIAYKLNDNRIFILPMQKTILGSDYYLTDGNFTSWSNAQLLIISSQEKESQTFTIYSNPGYKQTYLDSVIVKTSLEIGNEKRDNGYFHYEQSATIIDDMIIYNKIDTIPGADKSRHGWIENNYQSDNIQRRYFNAKQEEIPALPETKNSKNNSQSKSLPHPKTTLFINQTNLEIAQFHDASVRDDEGAYLGFESYEINNALAWNYKRTNLIKNDWPLTGEYCLRLSTKIDSIRRSLTPKNQNRSYQAACWIRSTITNSDHFKAIIKTNKNDILGILSATLLLSRGEWYYYEINIDLPQIRNDGALTPIYSAEVNGKLCFFQADTIQIEDQQNSVFCVLGVSQNTAIEQLLANVHNVELRSLVAPEIQIAFLRNTLPNIMKTKSEYKNIQEKYQQLKVSSDRIKVEIENYSKAEETFRDFIEYVVNTENYLPYLAEDDQTMTSTLDAIAKLNHIRFDIWKTNLNNELILFRTNKEKVTKQQQQTVHLLYTATSAQLQKLIDVTNKCLSKEKRDSLKQGHEYLLIDLIIQPTNDDNLDIDHIRFSPRDQQFYARVYHPQTYQVTALLDGNGSIKYMFYDQQYEPLAVTDWNKYLTELSMHGRNGLVLSFGTKLARQQPQNQMKIKPIHGFYEDFSKTSFEERWLIEKVENWKRMPGCLMHTAKSSECLILENEWIDEHSGGLHVQLDLNSNAKIEIRLHKHLITIECLNENKTNLIVNDESISSVPSSGEYLIIAEGKRLWLWINGQLQIDQAYQVRVDNSNYLSLNLTGNISLNQLFVFSKPAIDIVYRNILDEEFQTIQLENFQSATVSQTLYDDLGRQAIVTKPTQIIVDDDKPLLAFQNDFIHQDNNVWQTGKLIGTINKFNPKDEGYCYHQVRYADNPLNQKIATGKPGRLFTVNEIGSLKYTRDAQSYFIYLLFPSEQGYSVEACIQPHGTKQITVKDSRENQVASYVYTNMGNHLLTTYEYDDQNQLIQVLPPAYHAHHNVNTLSQIIPYTQLIDQWQTNEQQRNLQNSFATRMTYDKNGRIIERLSPDTSKQILIYSSEKLLRFILQHDINGKSCRVVYYQYDRWGDLSSQGYSTQCLTQEDLQNLANNYSDLPEAVPYLQMIKNNGSANANVRNKSVTSVINHSEGIWRESSTYIHEGKLSTREIMVLNDKLWQIYRLDYTYVGEYVASMTYPMLFRNQPFTITYSRNKQNRITAIGTPDNFERWVKFDYATHGQISDEIHISNSFTTHYDYNSPGYLEHIQNKYLNETIYYTEESYGQGGFFDGTIARTQFKALWFDHCDRRLLSLSSETVRQRLETVGTQITLKQAEYYLKCLENAGFLDKNRRVIKALLPRDAALYLPRECGGTVAYVLAELLNECFTQDYGHQYSYGNHMELVKAKYIVGDKSLKPIQPFSFEGISSRIDSKVIWDILVEKNYIQPDKDDGIHVQGKVNTNQWIDYETFRENLKQYADYDHLLATILQKYISRREILTFEKFEKIFFIWLEVDPDPEQRTIAIYIETAKAIWTILSSEGYLYSENKLCSLFKKEFNETLKNYQIPEIIGVLQEHSAYQMGESSCDVEAYMIDENGNHRHYWTGYARYELQYKETNNQIEHIVYKSMSRDKPQTRFQILHDALGNVTKAEHKGIMEIIYDPTTNRPKMIKLQDGRQVSYDYDVQGERVRKHVINSKGEKLKEVLYLRDGEGRSLVEKVIDFTASGRYEQDTGYLYGPKGLIGFVRNDEFYSVICDHEGSIRLIVKNQEIVAAYDYLPYGNLIRQYGIPQVQISYRYTGQEWDEETGLYNYHARLYDPDIGRFYQIDPQEQYASPYKYAGNSPVSMIDPNGEIAFLPVLMIGSGLLGAYLGGSAANNSWAPWEWDFKKASTYLGIGGGALAGALAPIGITASVSTLVAFGLTASGAIATASLIGVAGMYLAMAAGNDSWNPVQWQWSRPMTWSSGFQGFIFGASAIAGVCAWHQFYTALGVVGKVAFATSSGLLALGMGYLSCAAANQSFSFKQWRLSPGTIYAGLGGAFGGFMAPLGIMSTVNFISSFQTTNAQLLMGCGTCGSGLGTCYLFGSAANNSFTNWDMSSPKTYESIMGGFLFGISLPGLPKAFKDGMKNTSEAWENIKLNEQSRITLEADQKLATKILEKVEEKLRNQPPNAPKPTPNGTVSIITMEDGKKFYAYSGPDGKAVFYGEIPTNGADIVIDPKVTYKPSKDLSFAEVERGLGINQETISNQSGMANERGQDKPRAPENCGEPRAMSSAFKAGYSEDDIVSFSTFTRASTGPVPKTACGHCAYYVPGLICADFTFNNSFQNSFDFVIFTAQFSVQQLHQNSRAEFQKKDA